MSPWYHGQGSLLQYGQCNGCTLHYHEGYSTFVVSPVLTDTIFDMASTRSLVLSARLVQGQENHWVDSLSRFRDMAVEWHLKPQVFEALNLGLEVDLFAFLTMAQLPMFLTYSQRT